MSNLFSKTIIKSAISGLQGLSLEKEITIVQELYQDLQKGRTTSESSYQQRFNNLFFGELLGYDEHVHRIPDASTPVGGKKADVGLGIFTDEGYSYEGVQCVVELKGSGTLLDKKQSGAYAGLTPVDQGFGYKTSFKHCPWLIVSNFGSVRLYKDNKQDFEFWTLEDLIKSDNDYYHLKSLLVILGKKYLISESGPSLTEQRLSQVRVRQEKITKEFYSDYKTLRFELINDIQRHNPDASVEVVVEKSQKIIDRIIFVHFCEDKGLLPYGKLAQVVKHGEQAMNPTYITLNNFFEAVNSGSPKLEIPNGYNGGLFHTDPILNNLTISDAICNKFVQLGQYNFDDELSVNILGHIFEQSISDIEQLKIDLLGQETQTDQLVEKKESKRKKDGIFYTPEYIVDYIVQHSLMTYLEEQENECLRKYPNNEIKAYQAYQHILQQVKVLDPACGSGAFLVNVFDHLYAENKRVGEIIGGLFDETQTYKDILRNNIYGVDLNPESVEITKLSLWLKSAQKGKKLNNLDANIRCGNSLISDPAVAGDRAFDWNTEFADIIGAGGFDIIVGNPPYVQLQKMKDGSEKLSKLGYETFEKTGDLYCLFYELGIKLLSNHGYLGYITSNKRLRANYGSTLRQYLVDNAELKLLIDLGSGIFESATVDSNILIAVKSKVKKQNLTAMDISKEKDLISFELFDNQKTNLTNLGGGARTISNLQEQELFKKINKKGIKLKDMSIDINRGILTGFNEAFVIDQAKYEELIRLDSKNKEILKPLLRGRDVKRYVVSYENLRLINTHNGYTDQNGTKIKPIQIEDYPSIKNHLDEYYQQLLKRQDKGITPYNLRNCAYVEYFNKPKLIYPDIESKLSFQLDTEGFCFNNTAYGLNTDSKYLLITLNSKLINRFYKKISAQLGERGIRHFTIYIENIPIVDISHSDQQPFISKADLMLDLHQQLHESADRVIRFVTQKYGISKPSTKLLKFWESDYTSFLAQLKGVKISLTEQADLMDYFDTKKKEILALKSQIDATDAQIDAMVFDLYGLTEEERRVVMES